MGNDIKTKLPTNVQTKLTTKQEASARAAEQKASAAQAKALAERAITVFNAGLFSSEDTNKCTIPPKLYLNPSAVGFFDSLHDFGYKFCDTESEIIKQKTINYGYSKFMFTYLLYGGYPELADVSTITPTTTPPPNFGLLEFQANYSYLKGYTRPISPEGLENYFVIGNMYNIVRDEPSLAERIQYYIGQRSLPVKERRSLPELQDTTNGDLQIVINTKLNYLRTNDDQHYVFDN